MKKNTLGIAIPSAVVCVLAFVDADYQNLGVLDIVTLVCAGIALASIAVYALKRKGE